MPIATNPDTGEVLFQDTDGSWKPAKRAVNPDTKEAMAFDGNEWKPITVQSKGVMNYIDDVVRALAVGATFGQADKAVAGAQTLFNDKSYSENVEQQKAQTEAIPAVIKIPGEIAGAVGATIAAAPVTGTLAAVSGVAKLPGIVRAIGSGAGVGAAFGAGEAPLGSEVKGGLVGAATGAVAGGVMQPAIAGASSLAKYGKGALQNFINNRASTKVAGAISKDVKAGDAGMSVKQFQEAQANGFPAVVADLGGKETNDLVRSIYNRSSQAGAMIKNFADDRFSGQTGRASEFIQGLSGAKSDVPKLIEQVDQRARAANGPAYNAAYEAGDHAIINNELKVLSGAPEVQAALQAASKNWKGWQIFDGYGALNKKTEEWAKNMANGLYKPGSGTIPTYPNVQFWDYTARELSGWAAKASASGDKATALKLGTFAQRIKDQLDEMVPQYGAAREQARGFFDSQKAIQFGKDMITSKIDKNQARRSLETMESDARELAKQGFVGELLNKISIVGDTTNIVNKIMQNPDARERAVLMLGEKDAKGLFTYLGAESAMTKLRNAVTGQSTTAEQASKLLKAGAYHVLLPATVFGAGAYLSDPKAGMEAALAFGLGHVGYKIDQRTALQMAKILTSRDPKLLTEGLKILSKNKTLNDALTRLSTRAVISVAAPAMNKALTPNATFSPQYP